MPELPDVSIYVERLQALLGDRVLTKVRVRSPSLVRSADPPLSETFGRRVLAFSRLGKRIVMRLSARETAQDAYPDLHIVLHLMISGRLHMKPAGCAIPGKVGMAAFDFDHASLLLTEASSHKRAQLYVLGDRSALAQLDRGGLEVLDSQLDAFSDALTRESHTLKRALTDPRLLSGIGNAYSDEILHHAQLSPVKLTRTLTNGEIAKLHASCKEVLQLWTDRLRVETGDGFPEKVTAFRPGMAVHGRYGKPCPTCATPVQRIAYANNETNYCPTCQTGGKLLADRGLSRLLKQDWPKTLADLEEHMAARKL